MKKKVLFRDEPYWFEVSLSRHYETIGSWLRVYVKREGFWGNIFPYRCIGQYKGYKSVAKSHEQLCKLLRESVEQEKGKPVLIECSAEVCELYKD